MVSRRYQQSPVFYEPTPARWPWVLALVLIIGAAGAVFYFRPDLAPIPRGQLGAFTWGAETPAPVVATPDAAESAPPAVAEVSSPAAPDMTADDVAAAWIERWNAGDFAGLYALTSGTVQRTISRDDFIARYQGIAERAELRSVHAEIDPGADSRASRANHGHV